MSEKLTETRVRAVDFGNAWPLTVPDVILSVGAGAMMVIHRGDYYGLNGHASAYMRRNDIEERDLRDIWLSNPDIPGDARKSLHPLIQRAQQLEASAEGRETKRDRRWRTRRRRKRQNG